jgi:hypothetical protein
VALMHELFDRPVYLEDGTCLDGTRGGQAANAFCPTGPGGGVDPSCGKWASQGGSVTVEEWGHAHGHIFHAEIGGKSVGRAKLYESNSMSELFGKPSFYVSGLHVKDEYRRQGAAKAIYLKILEHIGDAYLVPDFRQTAGASSLWKSLSSLPHVETKEVQANGVTYKGIRLRSAVVNAFCPTGPGGGIDPHCPPQKGGRLPPSLKEFKEKGATKEEISEFNKLNKERSELNKKVKADTATDEERAKRDVVLGRLEDLRMTIRTRYDAGNADKATILDKKTTKKPEAQKDSEKDKAAAEEARKPFFKGEEATLDRMKERLQRRPIGSTEADETHKMMKEMEQDAGDPTVHGMLTSERMKSFKVEGLEVKYPEGARDAAAQTIASVLIGEKLPQKLWDANSTIVFSTQRNKDDAYWAKQYGMPGLKSAATGGDGSIVVYNAESISRGNFAHESGHNLAYKEWGSIYPDATSRYSKAQSVEQPVSPYGSKSHAEDFAEASKIYVDSAHSYGGIVHRRQHGRFLTGKEYLEKEFPLKHAAVHEILTGEQYVGNQESTENVFCPTGEGGGLTQLAPLVRAGGPAGPPSVRERSLLSSAWRSASIIALLVRNLLGKRARCSK